MVSGEPGGSVSLEAGAAAEGDMNPEAGAWSGRALILVVERDPHVRELEAFFLQEAGFAVEFTLDGESALQRALALRPDIVITEILVPRLDGLSLCRQLKASDDLPHVKVLIFSILAAAGRAREAGADAFLMKPLAERRLVETVRELMSGRATIRAGGEP